MPTRLEVVEVLFRVATVYKLHGESGNGHAAMIAETSKLGACLALNELTLAGVITQRQGNETINRALEAVMDPARDYDQEKFDADERYLNEHISLILGVPDAEPVEVQQVLRQLERQLR